MAGNGAAVDRYIGYMKSYAESREALDRDDAVQEELRLVARTLVEAVQLQRAREFMEPGEALADARPK